MTDKNFDIACQLADDLYFKFIDSLHDDVANEYVIADEDNVLWIPGIKKAHQDKTNTKILYVYEVE